MLAISLYIFIAVEISNYLRFLIEDIDYPVCRNLNNKIPFDDWWCDPQYHTFSYASLAGDNVLIADDGFRLYFGIYI